MQGKGKFTVVVVSGLLALLALPGLASAANYNVNIGTEPRPGGLDPCDVDVAAGADCTLREAVQLANASPDVDSITLTVDSELSLDGTDENLNVSDDIDVNGNAGGVLTIRSNGTTVADRKKISVSAADNFRVIDAYSALTIENVEITGGDAVTVPKQGGGLRYVSFNDAPLRLDQALIHDNSVGSGPGDASGGGVYATSGPVEIVNNTRIEDNEAGTSISGVIAYGGGLHLTGGATATITGSIFKRNKAATGGATSTSEGRGGGIYYRAQGDPQELTITNSTIEQNHAGGLGSQGNLNFGGGIYVESSSPGTAPVLDIDGGSVSDNTVGGGNGNAQGQGGGIRVLVQGASNTGTLTLDDVDLTGNRAGGSDGSSDPTLDNVAAGTGAGIATNADTTVTNGTRFLNNLAGVVESNPSRSTGGHGGAIYAETFSGATPDLIISDALIEGNRAGNAGGGSGSSGGAILSTNDGPLTISDSTLTDNDARGSGGAISRSTSTAGGPDSITDTTIAGSDATFGGGIDLTTQRLFTINRSLLSGNTAKQWGGSVSASSDSSTAPLGKLQLVNSTVSYSSAGENTPAGSLLALGGGIAFVPGHPMDFDAIFSTIASNTLYVGADTSPSFGRGGNIRFHYNVAPATLPVLTFTGSIVSGGALVKTDPLAPTPADPNCSFGAGGVTATSNGGNLEGLDSLGAMTNSCMFTNTALGDQVGIDALLDPFFGNNGGPTQTRKLLPGSPAVDAAPNSVCGTTTTDQRGFLRPSVPGGECDSGAYEDQPPVLAPIGDKTVQAGQHLNFAISATDLDPLDVIAYSAMTLPAGATLDADTFNWTPTPAQVGTHDVTFEASDGNLTDSETITITVTAPPPAGSVPGAVPPPAGTPRKRCRKGFTLKKVKGKKRCVRKKRRK